MHPYTMKLDGSRLRHDPFHQSPFLSVRLRVVRAAVQYSSLAVIGRALVLIAALTLAAGGIQRAQGQNMDSTEVARFQLADALLKAGQYDRAITLLEDLYHAAPSNYAFYEKLRSAYEGVKQYEDAIALVQSRLADDRNARLLSDLARIYYLQDDEDLARQTWEEAVATGPTELSTYRIVNQSLLDVRQFEWAIEFLERAREVTGQTGAFRPDLAYLYNLTGVHDRAMEEYLQLLRENEQQLGFVRTRLSRFVEQEEALRSSITVAARAVREDPLNRAHRELLGWLYIEIESYEDALNEYRAIDRLEQQSGQVLFKFAQMAADAAAYDVASEAYREILGRYPDSPAAPQALAALGDMHERWAEKTGERPFNNQNQRLEAPHYEQALASYREFLEKHPEHVLYPEVLRRLGRLQQDVFYELDAAESTLEEVVREYPNTVAAAQAEYDLARLSLMRGELDDARLRFNRLIDRIRTGDLAEMARYQLARIHFFMGQFDAAQSLVDIIDVNTSTDVSNDAIELKLLLMENRGPDSLDAPLRQFAEAMLFHEQRHLQAALDGTESMLSSHPSHPLADDARFLRAELLRALDMSEDAAQAFQELPLLHPHSHLADRAVFAAAETFEHDLDDREAAARLYGRLLSDYPGSLLAAEARSRLRRLREDGA